MANNILIVLLVVVSLQFAWGNEQKERDLFGQFLNSGGSNTDSYRDRSHNSRPLLNGSRWRGSRSGNSYNHQYKPPTQGDFFSRTSNRNPSGSGGRYGSNVYKALAVTAYDSRGQPLHTTLVGGNQGNQHLIPCTGPQCRPIKTKSTKHGGSQYQYKYYMSTPQRQHVSHPTPSPQRSQPSDNVAPMQAPSMTPISMVTEEPTQVPTQSPDPPFAQRQQELSPFYSPIDNGPQPTYTDIGNLSPPQNVTEQSPSAPLANAPTNQPSKVSWVQKSVETDEVAYETVGSIDLKLVENEFFKHTQWLITPYLANQVGPMLQTYKLSITFMETTKETSQKSADISQALYYHNVFEAKIRYDLEGTHDEVESFTKKKGRNILEGFFRGAYLAELIERLTANGIPIKMIRSYDNTNPPPFIPAGDDEEKVPSGSSSGSSNVVLYVCLSFGLLLLFSVLIIFCVIRRRRSRRFYYSGQRLESPLNSVYSSGSESGSISNPIKPAAIQQRSSTSNSIQEEDLEGAYEDDPFPAVKSSSSRDFLFSKSRLLLSSSDEESSEQFQEEHGSPKEKGKVTQTTLTSLNGDGSLNELDHAYPEFEMFVNVGQNKFQSTSPKNDLERKHYDEQRMRWHDQASDVDVIGLPTFEDSDMNSQSSGSDHPRPNRLPTIS